MTSSPCQRCRYLRRNDIASTATTYRCHHPNVVSTALANAVGRSLRGWPYRFDASAVTQCDGRSDGEPGLRADDVIKIAASPAGRGVEQVTEALQTAAQLLVGSTKRIAELERETARQLTAKDERIDELEREVARLRQRLIATEEEVLVANRRCAELERENAVLRAGIGAAESATPGPWTLEGEPHEFAREPDYIGIEDANGRYLYEAEEKHARGTIEAFNAAVELCRKRERQP